MRCSSLLPLSPSFQASVVDFELHSTTQTNYWHCPPFDCVLFFIFCGCFTVLKKIKERERTTRCVGIVGMSNEPIEMAPVEAGGVIDKEGLVIYVAPRCPFCMRVKGLFESFNVEPKLIDTTDPANVDAYKAAVEKHQHFTVPMVLFNGELVGGCDSTCSAIERGDFARLINLPSANAIPKVGKERGDLVPPGLFNFPALVDIWTIRTVSLIVMVISILLIIFREHPWVWWVSFGMTLDFGIRVMFGGTASVAGSAAVALNFWRPEELVPGPPKQFAAMVGFFIYGFATILFHTGGGGDTTTAGGSVLMGVIAFFAALETFFNFCAGCYVFGWLVTWGIVKTSIYQPYTDSYEYTQYAVTEYSAKLGWVEGIVEKGSSPAGDKSTLGWRRKLLDERYRPNHLPLPRSQHVRELLAPNQESTIVDLRYKFPKFEDTQREKWSWKYVSFPDFASCMGTSGFALMLKFAQMEFKMQSAIWKAAALIAAIHFGILLLCLVAKAIFWPKKLFMDFQQPMKRNASGLIPIIFIVFSGLAININHNLAMTMFWCGAPACVVSVVVTFSYYMKNRQNAATYNPGVMIPTLSLFVVSLILPYLAMEMNDTNPERAQGYMETSKFFFGAGLMLAIVNFAGTMYHGVFFHWNADKMRPSIAMWMGGCFITCVSWMMTTQQTQFDMFAYVFYSTGIVIYLGILYLIFPGNWLLRGRFDMANWSVCFPLSVFGFASIMYYRSQRHPFSLGLCWVSWISAGYATITCTFHSIRLLLERKWPGPHPECSPLMFNKFLHDGFREVLARIRMECSFQPKADEMTNANARLLEMTTDYLHLLRVHTDYEISFMLPEFKAVSKAQVAVADEQHKYTLEDITKLEEMINANDIDGLRAALPLHCDIQYDFFQWEEDHLAPIVHKGMNGKIATLVLERIWETVPMEDLERLVVMGFRYIPKQMQRAMFLKAITAALPERSQQIGLWLYRNASFDALGDIKLSLLFEDMPEIVPRGLGLSWTRQM